MAVIAVGYRAPEQSSAAVSAAPVANIADTDKPAVNDVVATNIAASVATAAELAVAPNVTELAISTRVQSQYQNQSTDTSSISKPAIVQLSMASRNISTYTIADGDTVASVAGKFGINENTVRWANNLKESDSIKPGATLDVLPVNGIVYTVKDGDTLQSIADKYKGDASLIATYNDLEINGVTTGLKIIIPNGVLPNEERPGYISPAIHYSTGFVTGVGAWGGNVLSMRIFTGVDANSGGYAPGNCTAYAYYRRAQIGRPVPSQLGNAYTWATQARAFNYVVNSIPEVGAVIQSGNHVGVVEEIYANGDLRITDMNYGYRLYNLAERVIPASTVSNYAFIH
ncbi:hypothetical protein BGO18_03575 [Candidatus Saccharibacteria bacterium 47-87]|nr:LysM peptidoglycan-binding domain-containing protein [Candidatus Saccharibacteria bacterium]OJU97221.1 MAG: hypothetical protein BGO18_03575 [Candidatus Saccharibacteria bacterium 47-87]